MAARRGDSNSDGGYDSDESDDSMPGTRTDSESDDDMLGEGLRRMCERREEEKQESIQLQVAARTTEVARDLLSLRVDSGLSQTQVRDLKSYARKWHNLCAGETYLKLQPLMRDGVSAEAVMKALSSIDIFEGLRSSYLELSAARRDLPVIEPRVSQVTNPEGKTSEVVSFDLVELLRRKLEYDQEFLASAIALSDRLKTGQHFCVEEQGAVADVLDGVEARFHPHLHRQATDTEVNDLRMPFLFYSDDVEVRPKPARRAPCDRRSPRDRRPANITTPRHRWPTPSARAEEFTKSTGVNLRLSACPQTRGSSQTISSSPS